MKKLTWKMLFAAIVIISLAAVILKQDSSQHTMAASQKGCVFMTLFGEQASAGFATFKTPEAVQASIHKGLDWLVRAQHNDGGWGAGSRSRQDIRDPHAVPADPATTAMVGMALIRNGNTLTCGKYAPQLRSALNYLLNAVETSPENDLNITSLKGTQIQGKLGANIDVILASQFLANIKPHTTYDAALSNRVTLAMNTCVRKIQQAQDSNGSVKGAGWAGVLQSSLAGNALESAEQAGADVDDEAIERANDYQKKNVDTETGKVNTEMGAGIVLYAVSGSGRASASDARRVKESIDKAKASGSIPAAAPVNSETLEKIGYSKSEAMQLATSYNVYKSATTQAQREDVMTGFGNNGGEEFLSYLQTGEALVIAKDESWMKWYNNMSGRLLTIQENNGSWQGHHCITSPVFCTATCLLILAVNEDVERLNQIGIKK